MKIEVSINVSLSLSPFMSPPYFVGLRIRGRGIWMMSPSFRYICGSACMDRYFFHFADVSCEHIGISVRASARAKKQICKDNNNSGRYSGLFSRFLI